MGSGESIGHLSLLYLKTKTKLLVFDNKIADHHNISALLDGEQIYASSHTKFLGIYY